jgi:osmotically-inducible protein OsmY
LASNAQLRKNIEKEIFAFDMNEKTSINVDVDDGWVYLEGHVPSLRERETVMAKIIRQGSG